MGTIADAMNLPGGLAVGQQDQPPIPQGGTLGGFAGLSQNMAPAPDVQNADAVSQEAVDGLRTQGQLSRAGNPAAAFGKVHYNTDKDGNTRVMTEMPLQTFDTLSQLMQTGQATISAFDQARQQLAAKQQFLQQNPIVAGLGSIFSSAAAQYAGGPHQAGRIAPLVRAAGAYGLQTFGKSPDELAIEQAQLQQQEFGVTQQLQSETDRQTALGQQQEATTNEEQNRAFLQQQAVKKDQELQQYRVDETYGKVAGAGAFTPGVAAAAQAAYVKAGFSVDDAKGRVQALQAQSEAKLAERGLVQETKPIGGRIKQIWSDPRTGNVVKTNDLGAAEPSEADLKRQDKAETAKAIALGWVSKDPNDLVRGEDLASKRNDVLAQAYVEAKKLDPDFSPVQNKNRVAAVNFYNDPSKPGAQAIVSLGQFVQHADEAKSDIVALNNTNSPLVNTVFNKVKENAEGYPQLAAARVSMAAAGKEYEKFLLASGRSTGGALYESDRKELATILDGSKTTAEAAAALQRMGTIAQAKFNDMDNGFQRLFPGYHIGDNKAFSPEDHAAAARLGFSLGGTRPPGAPVQGQVGPQQVAPAPPALKPNTQYRDQKGNVVTTDAQGRLPQ